MNKLIEFASTVGWEGAYIARRPPPLIKILHINWKNKRQKNLNGPTSNGPDVCSKFCTGPALDLNGKYLVQGPMSVYLHQSKTRIKMQFGRLA